MNTKIYIYNLPLAQSAWFEETGNEVFIQAFLIRIGDVWWDIVVDRDNVARTRSVADGSYDTRLFTEPQSLPMCVVQRIVQLATTSVVNGIEEAVGKAVGAARGRHGY